MTSGVYSFDNSFTLDSTPRELQINLQLIRPVALRSIDVLTV